MPLTLLPTHIRALDRGRKGLCLRAVRSAPYDVGLCKAVSLHCSFADAHSI